MLADTRAIWYAAYKAMRKMTKRLEQVAPYVTMREALAKFAICWLVIPVPIAVFTISGFWLDCYRLDTFPLFTVLGAVLGAVLSIIGAVRIFVFGHKDNLKKIGRDDR